MRCFKQLTIEETAMQLSCVLSPRATGRTNRNQLDALPKNVIGYCVGAQAEIIARTEERIA